MCYRQKEKGVDRVLLVASRYANLVGTRVALGIAEAGLFPGVVY